MNSPGASRRDRVAEHAQQLRAGERGRGGVQLPEIGVQLPPKTQELGADDEPVRRDLHGYRTGRPGPPAPCASRPRPARWPSPRPEPRLSSARGPSRLPSATRLPGGRRAAGAATNDLAGGCSGPHDGFRSAKTRQTRIAPASTPAGSTAPDPRSARSSRLGARRDSESNEATLAPWRRSATSCSGCRPRLESCSGSPPATSMPSCSSLSTRATSGR